MYTNKKGVNYMNVYGITKKSIDFFINFFNKRVDNEDGIKRFVENEYRADDREWAYIHFKNKNV